MNVETANRLQMLRKKNGYSQEELAEKIGISRQAVSKWERAEASPDTDNLILLARLYGVTIDELLKTDSLYISTGEGISLHKEDYLHNRSDDEKIYPNSRQTPINGNNMSDDGEIYPNRRTVTVNNNNISDDGEIYPNRRQTFVNDGETNDGEVFPNGRQMFVIDNDQDDTPKRADYVGNASEIPEKEGRTDSNRNTGNSDSNNVRNAQNYNYDNADTNKTASKGNNVKSKHNATLLDKLFVLIVLFVFGVSIWIGLAEIGWIVFLAIPIYYVGSHYYKEYVCGNIPIDEFFRRTLNGTFPVIVTAMFFGVGMIFGGWNVIWIVFLTIPIYYVASKYYYHYRCGKIDGIKFLIKTLNGTVPVIVTMVFLTFGMLFGVWSFWGLFFIIPVYYIVSDHFTKK